MPDLATHILSAYLFRRGGQALGERTGKIPASPSGTRDDSRFHEWWSSLYENRLIFYLGNFLPDLVTRPVYIFFPQANSFVYFLHTPFAQVIVCYMLSRLFLDGREKAAFKWLLFGSLFHQSIDLLQYNIVSSYFIFFPFSFWSCHRQGLLEADTSLFILPFLVLITLIIIYNDWRRKPPKKSILDLF